MPVKIAKRGKKYRVIESRTGRIAKRSGKAVDGGGFASRTRARKQVQAINISLKRRAGSKIPKKRRHRRR